MSILQQIQEQIEDMPTIPIIAMQLMRIVSRKEHSMRDVAGVIENDPALTAKILRLANSAAFAGNRTFTTINSALVRLGTQLVVGLVLRTLSSGVFSTQVSDHESASEDIWDHSLRTAIASREISKLDKTGISHDLAFTAGLLHDIGKSVLADFLRDDSAKLTRWRDALSSQNCIEAERKTIGTDHSEVGFATAQKWGLPPVLCQAIRFHHNPADSDTEFAPVAFAVHLGDSIAMMGGDGIVSDSLVQNVDPQYSDYYEIPRTMLYKVLLSIEEEYSVTRNALSPVKRTD